ncbi:MAG: hypothetical protein KKI09_00685 [Spirochaetes bacterium]|nr:hypothetical protein [Spirochaetota bacterium]MBU0953915.1 hypothetical protein [Spirochaetota bacterium]
MAGLSLLWIGNCAYGQEESVSTQKSLSGSEFTLGGAVIEAAEKKPLQGLRLQPVAGVGGSMHAGVNGNLSRLGFFVEAGAGLQAAAAQAAWQLLLHAAGGWLAEDATWQLRLGVVLVMPVLGQVLAGICSALPSQASAAGQASWFPVFALRTPILQFLKEKFLVNLALDLEWTAYLQPDSQYLGEGYYLPLGQDDFIRGIQAGLVLAAYCRF